MDLAKTSYRGLNIEIRGEKIYMTLRSCQTSWSWPPIRQTLGNTEHVLRAVSLQQCLSGRLGQQALTSLWCLPQSFRLSHQAPGLGTVSRFYDDQGPSEGRYLAEKSELGRWIWETPNMEVVAEAGP